MTFALGGLLYGMLLLTLVYATAAVYSVPFPHQNPYSEPFRSQLNRMEIAIAVFLHFTLTSSLSSLLLMAIERLSVKFCLRPENFFTTAIPDLPKAKYFDDNDEHEATDGTFAGNLRSEYGSWKRPSSRIMSMRNRLTSNDITWKYFFSDSYTLIDVVNAVFVPTSSAIVTSVAVAAYGSRFELFGQIGGPDDLRKMGSLPGLLSYDIGSFPGILYFYLATIGVLFMAVWATNIVSKSRSNSLIEEAEQLPGYQYSKKVFKQEYNGTSSTKASSSRSTSARESARDSRFQDSIRPVRRKFGAGARHEPEGLSMPNSIENIDIGAIENEAIIELRTLSFRRQRPSISLDNLSLPPPPSRPESLAEIPERLSTFSFPSLPSILKEEQEQDLDDGEENVYELEESVVAIAEKARVFFSNIRQSKVVFFATIAFCLAALPLIIICGMGMFYPKDKLIAGTMGSTTDERNGILSALKKSNQQHEMMVNSKKTFAEMLPPDDPENLLKVQRDNAELWESAVRKNLIVTLAAAFSILYALASLLPFLIFCFTSRLFRREVMQFLSCFFCCNCKQNRKHRNTIYRYPVVMEPSRTNRDAATFVTTIRNPTYASSFNFTDVGRSWTPTGLTRDRNSSRVRPARQRGATLPDMRYGHR